MDKTIRLWRYEEEFSLGAGRLRRTTSSRRRRRRFTPGCSTTTTTNSTGGSTETPLAPAPHALRNDHRRRPGDAGRATVRCCWPGGDAPAPIRFDCRGGTRPRLGVRPRAPATAAPISSSSSVGDWPPASASAAMVLVDCALGDNDDAGRFGACVKLRAHRRARRGRGRRERWTRRLGALQERRPRQRVSTARPTLHCASGRRRRVPYPRRTRRLARRRERTQAAAPWSRRRCSRAATVIRTSTRPPPRRVSSRSCGPSRAACRAKRAPTSARAPPRKNGRMANAQRRDGGRGDHWPSPPFLKRKERGGRGARGRARAWATRAREGLATEGGRRRRGHGR